MSKSRSRCSLSSCSHAYPAWHVGLSSTSLATPFVSYRENGEPARQNNESSHGVQGLTPLFTAALILASLADLAAQTPQWIWHGEASDHSECYARVHFELKSAPKSADIYVTGDDHLRLFINGLEILSSDAWNLPEHRSIANKLKRGINVIAIQGRNDSGPAGLAARLDLTFASTVKQRIVSDQTWRSFGKKQLGWIEPGFDDSTWARPKILGSVGQDGLPWSTFLRTLVPKTMPIAPQRVRPATDLKVKSGFRVERVFSVPRHLGSLVSMTADDHGRLYVSDQRDGLFRVTPAKVGDADAMTRVERIDVGQGGAQGLLWAFDSLYAVVNGHGSGLYRITDTNGDDRLDAVQLLRSLRGAGEHGPHAVILAADRKHLLVAAGNHTLLTDVVGSRLPRNWGEDHLLPRQWDVNGHARGRLAPGGWICQVDPEGKHWELIGSGFRNQYDIALDRNGELWSYDADMEPDLGLPWYRPTRVCHVTSGAEFGWRSGTSKWPADYPDSVPPVLEMGPGSPTGIAFGTGAAFPARYQRALFSLDWTFGTIYAVHPRPDGSSYTAEKEEFVVGKPLPLTDLVVARDGALYFTVGGRNTASAIYRVLYTGDEDCAAIQGSDVSGAGERSLRRELESFHGKVDSRAIETAWKHLGHGDRHIRYAARLSVEAQPVAEWRDRALAKAEVSQSLGALLALARQGIKSDRVPLFRALARLSFGELSSQQQIDVLRIHALGFIRIGDPDAAQRRQMLKVFESSFPSGNKRVDSELCRVLVYLGSEIIVPRAMAIVSRSVSSKAPAWAVLIGRNDWYGNPIRRMLDNMPPIHGIELAFLLRTARTGWTQALRQSYFEFLERAATHRGGSGYRGYLMNIRREAIETCSPEEREALADLLASHFEPILAIEVVPPTGPGRAWDLTTAIRTVEGQLEKRDFKAGRNLFHATSCITCHRFDGEGGRIGPDLTSVIYRFTIPDLLQSMIEPSAVISDQYATSIVHRRDATSLHGLVVESGTGPRREVVVYPSDPKARATRLIGKDVLRIERSPVSQMPAGLITALNADELRDLCAYLLSGGDDKHRMFTQSK